MQGSSGSGMKPHVHQQQQQQTQQVRYPPQYYKLHKTTAGIDPSQYQLHYQMPVVSQQQQAIAMQVPLLHQQQQQQQHQSLQQQQFQQQNNTAQMMTTPDYQINNMFAKLSVNDIQLTQQQPLIAHNHMSASMTFPKPQPVNRKLFIKQNTQGVSSNNTAQSNGNSNNNDLLNQNTINTQISSNNMQSIDNQNMKNSKEFMNIPPTMQQQNYQTLQQHQDSLFTRSIDNFDITNRFNQNEQQQLQQQTYSNNMQQQQQNITQSQQQTYKFHLQQQQQMQQQQYLSQQNPLFQMSSALQMEGQNQMRSEAQNQSTSNRTSDVSISGAQTNRPQSAVSFNQSTYSRSATTTRKQQSIEPQPADANHEVIISNIDRDTVGHIIHELHSHGVQDLNYKLIEQQIFIVKFKNKDSADWAIEKYDKQVINGMKLQVRQVIQEKQTRGRRTHFLPLTKIFETNNDDGDEDIGSDGSNHSNREEEGHEKSKTPQNQALPSSLTHPTPDLSQIKMNMLAQQRATTPKISSESTSQGTATSGTYGSATKYSANYHQIQNLSQMSPNQSFQQPHNQNPLLQQSMTQRQGGYGNGMQLQDQYSTQGIPSHNNAQNQQLLYNSGINVAPNQHSYDQFGNIQLLMMSANQMSFQQLPQQTPMTNFSQYHQNMKDMKRSNSGILKIQNQLAHSVSHQKKLDMSQQLGISKDQMNKPRLGVVPKNLSFSLNTQKFKSQDFEDNNQDDNSDKYSQAFGYNSSGSGLLIQQQPQQQNLHQSFYDNHPSFGKISESIDDSQNDDINLCQLNYDASNNSERESILNQTMRNAQNTQTVKNISTRSDSDQSHQIQHQIMIQQYQSPESGQKLAMTQRIHNLNNSLDYMMMSNSGRDTPPKFSTPGSKLNNSFHHFGSSQNLSNYIRINNEIPQQQQHQGPYHARNFSAEQQFYQSELMQQQLFIPSQALNQSHLNHSMSIQSMQQFPNTTYYNYLSTSQDLNNISLYGQPISLNQHMTLSASNSSADLQSQRLSIQNRNKKGGNNKNDQQQKNHQQLKSAYKESSEPMTEEYYYIDENRIKSGEDMRTTVMVRNIPNKYKQKNLLDEINQNNKGKYDFVYLPIDFQNNANIGYGFVNFLNPLFILEFKEEFQNRRWKRFQSQKKCEIKYGRLQGIAELNQHFQNSTVSSQVDVQVRPRVFEENMRKDQTKEIQRVCNKYNLNPQIFLNFKNNNQQSLSTKPDAGSNLSVNSQQNTNIPQQQVVPKLDKSRSVDTTAHNNQQQINAKQQRGNNLEEEKQ